MRTITRTSISLENDKSIILVKTKDLIVDKPIVSKVINTLTSSNPYLFVDTQSSVCISSILGGIRRNPSNIARAVFYTENRPTTILATILGEDRLVKMNFENSEFIDLTLNLYKVRRIQLELGSESQLNIEFPSIPISKPYDLLSCERKKVYENFSLLISESANPQNWSPMEKENQLMYPSNFAVGIAGYKIYISTWPFWWVSKDFLVFMKELAKLVDESKIQHIKISKPEYLFANKEIMLNSPIVETFSTIRTAKDITLYAGSDIEKVRKLYQHIRFLLNTFLTTREEWSVPLPLFLDFMISETLPMALRFSVYHGGNFPDGKIDTSYNSEDPFYGKVNPLTRKMTSDLGFSLMNDHLELRQIYTRRIDILNKHLLNDPKNPCIHMERCFAFAILGNYREAKAAQTASYQINLEILESAIKENPNLLHLKANYDKLLR